MIRHRLAARVAKLRDAQQRDAGFTVLEVLISFVVFAIVATTASYGLVKAIEASHGSQQRVDAANIAQGFVADAIRRANFIAPVEGQTIFSHVGPDPNDTYDSSDEQFTVVQTIDFDVAGSCNLGTLFWVHIIVRQAQSDQFLARSDARVACPRV